MIRPQARLNLDYGAWKRIRMRHGRPESLRVDCEMRCVGAWLSLLKKFQRAVWQTSLDRTELVDPIFIVGHWRSGTTLLHELLCANSSFAAPSTYACMNPHHFLLTQRAIQRESGKSARRPMDTMVISAASPQEDEFALLCLGEPTPYEALLYPQALESSLRDLERQPLSDDASNTLLTFLKGIKADKDGMRLVVKSPPHSLRIAVLARLFPQAKFIHIVRNPIDVFFSSVRMWKELFKLYCVGESLEDGKLAVIVQNSILHFDAAIERAAAELPAGTIAQLRFEDLMQEPLAQIRQLYRALKLGDFETLREALSNDIAKRNSYQPARYSVSHQEQERLESVFRDVLTRRKYTA